MVVLDEIDNFRMSCEKHPVDALLRMENLQRKIISSNRTCSNYPDALVSTKFVNVLLREYDFQKQLLKSREGEMTRKVIVVTVAQDRYDSPEFEPSREKKKETDWRLRFHGQRIEFSPWRWRRPRP